MIMKVICLESFGNDFLPLHDVRLIYNCKMIEVRRIIETLDVSCSGTRHYLDDWMTDWERATGADRGGGMLRQVSTPPPPAERPGRGGGGDSSAPVNTVS